MAISIKTPEDIAGLRIAGRLAAELLDYLTPFVKPGVSTGELDRLAYDYTVNVQKCIPACLGYTPPGMTPYPATTCISINHVVCHGIPSDKKILKQGDIVNIDVTSIKNGYHGDTSRMFIVGKPTIAGKRMVDLAFNTMWAGIDAVRPGGCFNDIGIACQRYADQNGISVDVVLLAEIVYCTCNLTTCILTLLRSENQTECCTGDSTAEESTNVT